MSGIDKITEKILEQAELQAENRLKNAREKAQQDKAELNKRLKRIREAEIVRAELEGKSQATRIVGDVMLEGRKKRLSARQNAVNQVFDEALDRIIKLSDDEYVEFISKMVVPFLDNGENELMLSEKDAKKIGEKLIERLANKVPEKKVSISKENISSIGGVIVRNGYIQTNLTLEAVFRQEKARLEPQVVDILFGTE